jgi:nucleoside-diphosphate-sugar epimerase
VFWPALEDTSISIVGDINGPRSLSYIDDVAFGLIMLGEAHDSTGHVWHLPCAPPISPSELASQVIAQARSSAEIGSSPRHIRGCALYQLKIVRSDISEVQHELHSLDRPFVLNHSNFTTAHGEHVTSHADAIRTTLAWFTAHPRPITEPIIERVFERLPKVARTTRIARRFGAGALGLARTSL